MQIELWLSLVILFAAGGLTPGPAVMLVIASSLRNGACMALIAGLGICAANVVWISLAAAGAGTLASQFPTAFFILKLIGLGFVLWLAFSMAVQPVSTHFEEDVAEVLSGPRRQIGQLKRAGGLFLKGFGLQLANPNALVFFGGLLPAFFDVSSPIVVQVVVMIITVTATELFGLTVYAFAAQLLSHKFSEPRFARIFYVCAALLMVGSVAWALITQYL
ncbi:LysE family translocator [Ponticaulis sp.]|uniref:LysE family translocator n=1 Tax=Ponticaulis sp. TaxID=2020902 RepID=UPI000B735AC8|nr:LysE family translocator [Ponticaulis sp.]MAI91003.1 lysine transporter LysE [Ponticaulis sp.]OUX98342.1 MAG: hypothetical protein CBB65_11200 [Hyphomonadaceae bacterium TMED5]|tara:strand:+ start:136908 stop:137564 length:657 start_codon:yes stop_codon:yes gene_type:complete